MADLPPLIEQMRLAINAQDFDRFIATFAPDAEVNDWNVRFKGPARSDTELIGAKGTLTVSRVISSADGVTVFDADGRRVITADRGGSQ